MFRGKSVLCLFYLLLLQTHGSTPGGKRKQKHLEREREPHRHPLNRLTLGYLKLSDVLTEASSGRDLEERVFIQGGAGLRWYSSADVDEPVTSDSFSAVVLN